MDHAPPQPIGVAYEGSREHVHGEDNSYPPFTTEGPAPDMLPQPNIVEVSQPHPIQPIVLSVGGLPPAAERREKLDLLEERLRVVEGFGDFLFANMMGLCLGPDVIIPPKSKVPDFDKYKRTTCPKNHLKMYCGKIGAHSRDEKLLMHFF